MIRILIADDHLLFRMGLKTMIGTVTDMQIVGEANSGQATVEAFRQLRPDVTLLDLRMPDGDGMQALRQILAQDRGARVLILSSYGSEEEVYAAMRAGAAGYVIKNVDQQELTDAIRKASAGQNHLAPPLAKLLADREPRPDLTAREHDVLQLIARGLINREIAQVLGTSESTVRNHTIRLFAKLDVSDRTEAAVMAVQKGIICL